MDNQNKISQKPQTENMHDPRHSEFTSLEQDRKVSGSKTLKLPIRKLYLLIILLILLSCLTLASILISPFTQKPKPQQTTLQPFPTISPTATIDETVNWKTYENKEFGFTLRYPENWIVGDFSTEPDPTIYFVSTKTNITFNPFENTTKVIVAPHGFGSEPPSGRILSDGTPFAKFLTINTTLSSWRKLGFVYGSVEVKNLSTTCERDGVVIKSGCDYYGSDRLVYHGTIDMSTWKTIDQILSTFKFLE